jgi:hypothetical protein
MRHDREQVRESLQRMLANGPVAQLPAREADLEILLALAGAKFVPGRQYGEREINEVLREWLATFCLPGGVDHVTLRRCLVDARFLTRNKPGSAYAATAGRVGDVLADAARDIEPAEILAEVRHHRESRKRDRSRQEARS